MYLFLFLSNMIMISMAVEELNPNLYHVIKTNLNKKTPIYPLYVYFVCPLNDSLHNIRKKKKRNSPHCAREKNLMPENKFLI